VFSDSRVFIFSSSIPFKLLFIFLRNYCDSILFCPEFPAPAPLFVGLLTHNRAPPSRQWSHPSARPALSGFFFFPCTLSERCRSRVSSNFPNDAFLNALHPPLCLSFTSCATFGDKPGPLCRYVYYRPFFKFFGSGPKRGGRPFQPLSNLLIPPQCGSWFTFAPADYQKSLSSLRNRPFFPHRESVSAFHSTVPAETPLSVKLPLVVVPQRLGLSLLFRVFREWAPSVTIYLFSAYS